MVAIVTQSFKDDILDKLYSEVDSAGNHFYVGIARTLPWADGDTLESPTLSAALEREVRDSLQSVKKVSAYSRVVTRNNWSSGAIYDAYTNGGTPSNPFYVITDELNVYLCIQKSISATGAAVVSTVKPTTTSTTTPESTADGYVWKYLYTLGSVQANNFLSANYVPVRFYDSDTAIEGYEQTAYAVQQAAVAGEVVNIDVTASGSGYTTATVVISGDGTGAAATATINGGAITKIEMTNYGSGYTRASATITGDGTGATLTPNISIDGIGANPVKDLRSDAIMYHVKIDGDEGGDFIVDNDYRQVTLLRNPKGMADSDFTDVSGVVSKRMNIQSGYTSQPSPDDIITSVSGASAVVDTFDATNDVLWYHQTEETGYQDFVAGETILDYTGFAIEAAGAFIDPDINNQSGDVLYVSNRAAVSRASDQIDDVKIIIKV
jgi:hypothetical protein